MQNDVLFRKTLDGRPLRCLGTSESAEVLIKTHENEHQGWRKLFEQMLLAGYYWPTMERDSRQHVRRCQPCQKFGDLIHAPSVELRSVSAPYPFHTWAMDLVGPISPPSRTHRWILAATENCTKWVEAVPLTNANGAAVARFIKENIICRFGIPKMILSDNGTPFINRKVSALLGSYNVDHRTSSAYYPQGNGQAEATNKTLVRILSKLLDERGGTWADHLPTALWAYRTSRRKSTRASPYSLVYGTEAVLPAEISVPSARLAHAAECSVEERILELEALEEKRNNAALEQKRYWQSVAKYYNKSVVARTFQVGDLVWKATSAVMRNVETPKFTPRWEGPYEITRASGAGYYHLARVENGLRTGAVNAKYIKKLYP